MKTFRKMPYWKLENGTSVYKIQHGQYSQSSRSSVLELTAAGDSAGSRPGSAPGPGTFFLGSFWPHFHNVPHDFWSTSALAS